MNPSDQMAAETNSGQTRFPNLARRQPASDIVCAEIDAVVEQELQAAGIEAHPLYSRLRSEVPTKWFGAHCTWSFERFWYYWVAKGPGVPPEVAEKFHKVWGQQVRVDGHCGCPGPLEWARGFAIVLYHIDTAEGLRAFAELLGSIYIRGDDDEDEKAESKAG